MKIDVTSFVSWPQPAVIIFNFIGTISGYFHGTKKRRKSVILTK